MKEVYILHNQDLFYLNKQGNWVPSCEANTLWHTPHKDVALNHRVEQTIKHPELRAEIAEAQLNEKGHPIAQQPTPAEAIEAYEQAKQAAAVAEAEQNESDLSAAAQAIENSEAPENQSSTAITETNAELA